MCNILIKFIACKIFVWSYKTELNCYRDQLKKLHQGVPSVNNCNTDQENQNKQRVSDTPPVSFMASSFIGQNVLLHRGVSRSYVKNCYPNHSVFIVRKWPFFTHFFFFFYYSFKNTMDWAANRFVDFTGNEKNIIIPGVVLCL